MDLELEREKHQMTDKQKEAIEYFKKRIDICMENANICDDNDFDEEATCLRKEQILTETVLNLIQTQQAEIEHQKEKRENQKKELSILNEKQKEFNKLRNTVNSYKGQFKRQQTEIEKKDKIIDEMATYIATLDIEEDICVKVGKENGCDQMAYGECEECIKKYFERKAKNE